MMRRALVEVLSDAIDEGGDSIVGASICDVGKLKVVKALHSTTMLVEQHIQDMWGGWQLV